MDLPKRKQIRLQNYDYSSPGAYFVTFCIRDRRCILSDITVGALHEAPAVSLNLTEIGQIVKEFIEILPSRYPDLAVEHYVIMPNHIHLLLRIDTERALLRPEQSEVVPIGKAPLRTGESRSLLAKAIGFLKMNSSKLVHQKYPRLELWQRSYHEHVIRNENDYREIWEYIEANPVRWAEDRYFIECAYSAEEKGID